jgi:hypothetical protein
MRGDGLAGMTVREQAEHLKWCIEEITTPSPELMAAHPNLTRTEARIVGALQKAGDRGMTLSQIVAAIYWDRHIDDWPSGPENTVGVLVHRCRQKGVHIETVRGRCYRIPSAPVLAHAGHPRSEVPASAGINSAAGSRAIGSAALS